MSGMINIPKKEERVDDIKGLVYSMLGKIYLTRPTFFGLDSQQIIIVVSPTLKILHIGTTKNDLLKNFPQKVDEKLDSEKLMNWANVNKFVITFEAPTPKLNRKLYFKFSNVIDEHKKEFKDHIIESKLPKNIKNRALADEEWFKTSLKEIFNKIK